MQRFCGAVADELRLPPGERAWGVSRDPGTGHGKGEVAPGGEEWLDQFEGFEYGKRA